MKCIECGHKIRTEMDTETCTSCTEDVEDS